MNRAAAAGPRPDPPRLFWQFYVAMVAWIGLVAVLVAWLAVHDYRGAAVRQAELDLLGNARLIRHLDGPAVFADPAARDRVQRVARDLGFRVTLIDAGGRAVADSEIDIGRLESLAGRPEIRAATASGSGTSERIDVTTGVMTLHCAVAITAERGLIGLVRTDDSLYTRDGGTITARLAHVDGQGATFGFAVPAIEAV